MLDGVIPMRVDLSGHMLCSRGVCICMLQPFRLGWHIKLVKQALGKAGQALSHSIHSSFLRWITARIGYLLCATASRLCVSCVKQHTHMLSYVTKETQAALAV